MEENKIEMFMYFLDKLIETNKKDESILLSEEFLEFFPYYQEIFVDDYNMRKYIINCLTKEGKEGKKKT